MDEWTLKTPNPICRLSFKIDLLTEFATLCLTDFIDWRYIHSLVGIFNPACELLSPWTKELYLCTVAPLSSLCPPPPHPLPKLNVQYIQTVCVWGVSCAVDHILQEFYTLLLTRFRTYQIASPPQTKWPLKTTLRGLVPLKFLRTWLYSIECDMGERGGGGKRSVWIPSCINFTSSLFKLYNNTHRSRDGHWKKIERTFQLPGSK